MQAKLPDINAALVTHRKSALNAYDIGDYSKAAIAFQSIIALLPEDYKVEINSDKYKKLLQQKKVMICDDCKEVFERNTIRPYEMLLSNIDSMLLLKRKAYVWDCPKCGTTRPLEGTQLQTRMFQAPYYFKVVPEAPVKLGLEDRVGYKVRCQKWFDTVFKEIENQIGLYRADYAAQQDQEDSVITDEDEK